MPLDKEYLARVQQVVAAIESRSEAELVVAIAPFSGEYGDVDLAVGTACGALALAFMLYSPWVFAESALFPTFAMCYAAGWFLSHRWGWLRMRFVPRRRRARHTHRAARERFLREAVDATPRRVGVLFYLSLLEGRLEIVTDHGLDGRLPAAVFHRFRHDVMHGPVDGMPERFLSQLATLEAPLAEKLPALPNAEHHIPNKPHLVS
jgi:putative membrane protein